MATTTSAFFDDYVDPSDLSFFTRGPVFRHLNENSTGSGQHIAGTNQNDIIFLRGGDTLDGAGGGYDVVVTGQDFTMSNDVEAVVLDGSRHADVVGNNLDNKIVGNAGRNEITAGGGNDIVAAGEGNDSVIAGSGDDLVSGGAGRDSISGGSGNDSLLGGAGHDSIVGGSGNDVIDGGSGNDFLQGMVGNDELFGGDGDDRLLGGDGADTLVGGQGIDTLFGGAGRDVFVIQGNDDGIDKIQDFTRGDLIDLSETGANSFKDLEFRSDGNGNTVVTLSDGTKFKLVGIDPADIKKGWFQF